MKFIIKISFAILLILNITLSALAQEDNAGKRSNLLNRRNVQRGNIFAKSTTTTTEAAQEGDEFYDDNYEEGAGEEANANGNNNEQQVEEEVTTTTEAVKVIRPIIRPFRSNDDLLNALKKRQMNAKTSKAAAAVDRQNVPDKSANAEREEFSPAPRPAKTTKSTFTTQRKNRFGINKSKTQSQEQQIVDEPSTTPTSTFNKRGAQSRFSLRPERQA